MLCVLTVVAVNTSSVGAATIPEGFDKSVIGARGWALYSFSGTTSDQKKITLSPGDGFIIKAITSNNMWSVAYKDKTITVTPSACMVNMADIFNDMSKVEKNARSTTQGVYFHITNNYSNIYTYLDKNTLTPKKLLPNQRLYSWNTQFVPIYYNTALKIGKAKAYLSKNYPDSRFDFYDTFRPNDVSVKLSGAFNKVVPGGEWELLPQTSPLYKRWLLAYGPSYHNVGLAVDVTLRKANGNEYGTSSSPATYSPMHALYGKAVSSWSLSEGVSEVNGAAGTCIGKIKYKVAKDKTVTEIMRECFAYGNMGTLASEWWHYQDNESKNNGTFADKTGFSTGSNTTVSSKTPKTLVNPGSLVSVTMTNKGYLIEWDDLNVHGYRIMRKVNSGSWKKIADVDGSTISYVDESFTSVNGDKCVYTVVCLDEQNKTVSDYQSSKSVDLGSPVMLPVKQEGNTLKVCWNPVSGAAGYRVYVKKNDAAKWTRLPDVTEPVAVYSLSNDDVAGDNFVFTARSYGTDGKNLSGYRNVTDSDANITLKDIYALLGDTSGDEEIDVVDSGIIQRESSGISKANNPWYRIVGDINNDDVVDVVDATFIQRYIAEIKCIYPIGQPIIVNC